MREILFRGKFDNGGGQIYWAEGDLIHYSKEEVYILDQNYRLWDISHDGCKIDDLATIGQYIGIRDKNNTRIFEDDVLKITIKEEEDSIEYKLGVVKFSKERLEYIVTTKEGIEYTFGTMLQNAGFYKFEFEVIGNIHDNPELIK